MYKIILIVAKLTSFHDARSSKGLLWALMLNAKFSEWLHEGGAKIYGVKAAAVSEGYRGVVARSEIEPGRPMPG